MKFKLTLLAFLIGMMGFASVNCSNDKEQKPFATIQYRTPAVAICSKVPMTIVSHDVAILAAPQLTETAKYAFKSYKTVNDFAIIFDVSWSPLGGKVPVIPYKEKLSTGYVIDKRELLASQGINLAHPNS